MTRAVLSIGANLGDRLATLRACVAAIPGVRHVSGVYETPPWGPVPQQDYLNAVLVADGPLDPAGWLALAHEREQAAGRTREVRWGPRTLDVDVVAVDDVRSDDPALTLPHPRAHERAFVLVPWLDADPDAVLPGRGPVRDLLALLPDAERAGVRRTDEVLT